MKTTRTTRLHNQVHPPRPKKVRVDARGNETVQMWLRDGRTTMPFVTGLTPNGVSVLINSINTTLKSLGVSELPKNKFLITR